MLPASCNHVKPRHDAETSGICWPNFILDVATMLSPVMTLRPPLVLRITTERSCNHVKPRHDAESFYRISYAEN